MPSYRVTMTVGGLQPGVDPKSVLPAAVAAAEEFTIVEASGLTIVRGAPRIIVRFTADDAELAAQIGGHVVASTAGLAAVPTWKITAREGGRWYPSV